MIRLHFASSQFAQLIRHLMRDGGNQYLLDTLIKNAVADDQGVTVTMEKEDVHEQA